MKTSYSNSELKSFSSFLRFDFVNGSDILKYTLTDINLLYIVVTEALDVSYARNILAADVLTHALNFYESYGRTVGMRTLYHFVETYYRCSISGIGLAGRVLPSCPVRPVQPTRTSMSPALPENKEQRMASCNHSNQSGSTMDMQRLCNELTDGGEDVKRELKSVMNKPLFELFHLRKWAMSSISLEGINFRTFRALVMASFWFHDHYEIMRYFATIDVPRYCDQEEGHFAMNFIYAYTSKDIRAEMESGRISTTRFADAFPDILAMALVGFNTRITGTQLAEQLFMCAIDLDGDAKDINTKSLKRVYRSQKKYKRRVLLRKKVKYLSERWCPRIKLRTKDFVEWKGGYTVEMLDEYIEVIRRTGDEVSEWSFDAYVSRCT